VLQRFVEHLIGMPSARGPSTKMSVKFVAHQLAGLNS
jgi:hypothetical protein